MRFGDSQSHCLRQVVLDPFDVPVEQVGPCGGYLTRMECGSRHQGQTPARLTVAARSRPEIPISVVM